MTEPSKSNPDPKSILASLQNPKFIWRTADGISKEIGADPSQVATFLEGSPLIIRSSTANTGGQALYSLRSRYRDETPLMNRVISTIRNST